MVLAVPLVVFTALGISGTSVGAYHQLFYGPTPDSNLILNEPQSIRSDEWLVNTQKTIAQSEQNFPVINKNIGNGENMSMIIDTPYRAWSAIFKPHNLSFLILPLQNAFAFKWWVMGYLLIVSCYFFILMLAPKKRLLAATLALALFFSAFVQWWYLYGALGPMYYSLFIIITVVALCRQRVRWKQFALAAVLVYLLVCFALVLYPPFQIACALVAFFFLLGYFLQSRKGWDKKQLWQNLLLTAGSCVVAVAIVAAFLLTRTDVIQAVNHSVYPGAKRAIPSGTFYPIHFMSPQLGHQFLSANQTSHYLIDGVSPSNQSETSNFLLLLPFLFVPSVILLAYEYKRKQAIDWTLLLLNGLFAIFILHLFAPGFTPIAKLLQLGQVSAGRALIGIGLLNIAVIAVFMRNLSQKKFNFPRRPVLLYCFVVFALELWLNLYAHNHYDMFLSLHGAVLLALPLPIVVYFLLRKHFILAAFTYLVFSIFTAGGVNPLYKGLDTITHDPLSSAIKEIGATSDKTWVSSGGYLENIAVINNERTLSGVYDYPQTALWKNMPGAKEFVYNRYAHVGFQLEDDPATKTNMQLITADSFVVTASACDSYLRKQHVGFYVSTNILKGQCTSLEKTISYPYMTVYIYRLK